MPDIRPSAEDWKKFSQGLQSDAAPEVSASYMPSVEGALKFGKGMAIGADKAIVGMIPESAYNFVGMEGKKYKDFAASPGEGGAESAGEWTGDVGANVLPWFIPGAGELGIAAKGSELLGNLALAGRTAGRIGQKAYKLALGAGKTLRGAERGAVSGAVEAGLHNEDAPKAPTEQVKRGAVTGGTTAAEFTVGRLAYEALPPVAKHIVRAGAYGLTAGGAGMLLVDELGHHHWVPHALLYGLAGPLLGVAAASTKVPPAAMGAGAERAAQGMGYEQTSRPPSSDQSQDEIIGP